VFGAAVLDFWRSDVLRLFREELARHGRDCAQSGFGRQMKLE
jgi:hypothetical protein